MRGLKFTPTPGRNNIELKSSIQEQTRRLRISQFFQHKEANASENLFQKQSVFTPPRNRDRNLNHQIDVLNNLNLEKMETKSKSNFCNMEQREILKLANEIIVIKPADKREAVVILSAGPCQSLTMQHLSDKNIYKKLDSCIESNIQSQHQDF